MVISLLFGVKCPTFGLPEMKSAENGPAFSNAELFDVLEKNVMRHLTAVAWHGAFNYLAERALQPVKQTSSDANM